MWIHWKVINAENEKLGSSALMSQAMPEGHLASPDMVNMKFSAAVGYLYSV